MLSAARAAVGVLASGKECSVGIFRVKGADANQLKQFFLAAAAKDGNTYTETSLGGKTLLADPKAKGIQCGYFKGDALYFASADLAEDAAQLIASLP